MRQINRSSLDGIHDAIGIYLTEIDSHTAYDGQ
jgi:hypothetical protein